MTTGAIIDLIVIGALVVLIGIPILIGHIIKHGTRPIDWERDCPEFAHPKETHVQVVDD